MSNEISPQAARVVNAVTPQAGAAPLGEAQLEAARASFRQLAPELRAQVLDTLRDPKHPAADRALLEGLEHGYAAYVDARRSYSGLRPGQRVGQLDLWIDRDVNITGSGRGFATLGEAQTAARATAQGAERDAAVFRAPDGTFVMHPVSDLGRLGGGRDSRVHDLDRLGGYRLVSLATDTGVIALADDVTRLDTPYGREVLAALRSGRPITAVTGHGLVYASKGPLPDGTLRNSVGGGILTSTHFTSEEMLAAARAGRTNTQVLFMLGCNTAMLGDRETQMGRAFLQGNGARAYVGSRGFMQNGADTAGMTRMLEAWRQNPSATLSQIVDAENVRQRGNRMQDASLVIIGDGSVTYDELMR